MKKYLLIIILQFMSIGLFGFDTSALKQLLAGETELVGADFTDANITNKTFDGVDFTGANFTDAKLINVVFRNSKLDKAILTDADLKKSKFINCTHKNMIILKTKGMNNQTIKILKDKGALIVAGSIICQADTHVTADDKNEKEFIKAKLRSAAKMYLVAKNKDNKVKGVILAGDLADGGDNKSWDKVKKYFIVPIWNVLGRNNLYPCIGNHDRYIKGPGYDKTPFLQETYVTKMIVKYCKRWAPKKGADYYAKNIKGLNLRVVSLSECPTRNNFEPIKWFETIANKKRKMIVFSHYCPYRSKEWWSKSTYPRWNRIFGAMRGLSKKDAKKLDEKTGKAVRKKFKNRFIKYKDKVSIYVFGHIHKRFIEYWNGILTIGVGGSNRFALVSFTKEGVVVAVEFIYSTISPLIAIGKDVPPIRYYPEVFGLKKFVKKNSAKPKLPIFWGPQE